MDISDYIAILLGGAGFIISVVGLVVTPILNLKSKRLEKRLEYRFQLFHKIVELWESTNTETIDVPNLRLLLAETSKLIQLYGYSKEIKLFKTLFDAYNACANSQISNKALETEFKAFFTMSFNTYRNEIALGKLPD